VTPPTTGRHDRKSIRMRGHDYAQGGAYFVTICTEGRALLFGDIVDAAMHANDAGRMVEVTWHAAIARCRLVESGAFQLMPNHVHGLVVIAGTTGADPTTGATSLTDVMRRFKSMTTRLYAEQVRSGRWPALDGRLWQRGYYEHLARNDRSRERIVQYIAANPARWAFDRENPRAVGPTDA
jgi:REP element-mobilizing transposase RayT